MDTPKRTVTAEIFIQEPIEKVWHYWINPAHIKRWNNISEEWHTPVAENDLKIGGRLFLRMEKKDGSEGFNHEAIYDAIEINRKISYTTADDRKTTNLFKVVDNGVKLEETFEIPDGDDADSHRSFCQLILNSFKAYVESIN